MLNFITLEMEFWWQTDFIKLYGKRSYSVDLQAIMTMKGKEECNALKVAEQTREQKKKREEQLQRVLRQYGNFFQKTFERIHANFYWHGMRKHIKDFIKNGEECQRHKVESPARLLHPLPFPQRVHKKISMDFIEGLSPSDARGKTEFAQQHFPVFRPRGQGRFQ